MRPLPNELQKYILEFIPGSNCRFCNKQLLKINNKFCNKLCLFQYNYITWDDIIYIRNAVIILIITWSPVILLPSINKNDGIPQSKLAWGCGIVTFIILTLYTERHFFRKAMFYK